MRLDIQSNHNDVLRINESVLTVRAEVKDLKHKFEVREIKEDQKYTNESNQIFLAVLKQALDANTDNMAKANEANAQHMERALLENRRFFEESMQRISNQWRIHETDEHSKESKADEEEHNRLLHRK
mmetsp:Transcript_46333/g.74293  ORF Transcript_46333/g.74293 Transcript_46333/m.74293 type:complete len:127 (-) Transcript_46333:26-406(-)